MRKLILIVLFCAVDNFGTSSACFTTYDMCQEWVTNSGGMFVACVVKGNL